MNENTLIKSVASSNTIDKSEKAQLMTFDEIAAIIRTDNSEKLSEILVAERVGDINMRSNNDFQSLLMVACKVGSIDCARVL